MTSIAEWLCAWEDPTRRPSALLGQISEEAARDNPSDRIYTAILDTRSAMRAAALDGEHARHPAALPAHQALFGVPVAIKDNIEVANVPTSCGGRALARPAGTRDAAVVRQFERLGAVVLGKTNMDEAALGASGRNEHFGRCRNPRGDTLLSGGSSSGSAAAVARGQVLLAVGTDTLGSVRIPAALCGVVGFKPTPGSLSMEGVAPLYPPFDTLGLMAGSLRDMEHACGALELGANAGALPQTPRIMLLPDAALAGVDAEVAAHYRGTRNVLHGHAQWRPSEFRLSEFPAFDFAAAARAALWEVSSDFAARIGFQARAFAAGRAALGQELRDLLLRASTLAPERLDAGRLRLAEAQRLFTGGWGEADALLTPTCPTAAIDADAALPKSIADFTVPANVAGLPAVSWPQTLAPHGTVSLQLIGRAGRDRQLLEWAGRLQELLKDHSS